MANILTNVCYLFLSLETDVVGPSHEARKITSLDLDVTTNAEALGVGSEQRVGNGGSLGRLRRRFSFGRLNRN